MATRKPQTMAKRARELAVKERRERKAAKKAENAAMRAAGIPPEWLNRIEPEDDAVDQGQPEGATG